MVLLILVVEGRKNRMRNAIQLFAAKTREAERGLSVAVGHVASDTQRTNREGQSTQRARRRVGLCLSIYTYIHNRFIRYNREFNPKFLYLLQLFIFFFQLFLNLKM